MIFSQTIALSYRKLRSYRGKTILLVLPIAALFAGGVLLTSEARNVQQAISQHVLSTLQTADKYIRINQVQPAGAIGVSQQPYTAADAARIGHMAGVKQAALGVSIPAGQASTADLVPGHTLKLSSLTALESGLSQQYAQDSTTYNGSGAIPIVLSASQFQEQTENWKGQTSLSVNMAPPSSGQPANVDLNKSGGPIGTQAIPYDRHSLIGKEFTVSVGGLAPIQDYDVQPGSSFGQLTYQKSSDEAIAQKTADRRSALSPYWNYDQLATPKTYTFKVVGLIDDDTSQTAYIPPQAATQIMHDLIQNQLSSRTTTAIPAGQLSSTFTGLSFDGSTISASAAGSGSMMFGGGASATTYDIPGLVMQADASGQNSVVTNADIYTKAIPTSHSLFIKIASVLDRPQVVKELNDAGFAYQDTSNLDGLLGLQHRLATWVIVFTAVFGAVVVMALVVAFLRFVADSRREIGIFRALGATKSNISQLFSAQAVLAGLAAYVAGLSAGLVLVAVVAGPMSSWFNSSVQDALSDRAVSGALTDAHAFLVVNPRGIIILSILLWGAILVTSAVASVQAARVSPAEAIKTK